MKNLIYILLFLLSALNSVGQNTIVCKHDISLTQQQLDEVKTDKALVIFHTYNGAKYAFDDYKETYTTNSDWRAKFQKIDGYRVPSKAIAAGKTDKVIAALTIKSDDIIADSIQFVTGTGTRFEYEKMQDGRYAISLIGGPAGDAQEIYAVVKNKQGDYITAGKLLLVSYTEQHRKVVLVPVNGTMPDKAAVEKRLNEIYNPVCISWTVSVDKPFANMSWSKDGNGILNVEGSGMFSTLTDEMKALNAAYGKDRTIDAGTAYLFILNKGKGEDKLLQGDMPRGKQFGYIFTNSGNIENTIAHELGHGIYQLRHTFDIGFNNDSLADNLMNYKGGTALARPQWDMMHDKGLVIGVFEKDEDAMSFGNVPKGESGTSYLLDKPMNFVAISGKVVSLPKGAIVRFYCIDENSCDINGKLIGFKINGIEYLSKTIEIKAPMGSFSGFYKIVAGKYSEEVYKNSTTLLSLGKHLISFLHENALANGKEQIKVITEEKTLAPEQIEVTQGNYSGNRNNYVFTYNEQATVEAVDMLEYHSICDNHVNNPQTTDATITDPNEKYKAVVKKENGKWEVKITLLPGAKKHDKIPSNKKEGIEAEMSREATEKLNELGGLYGKKSERIDEKTEDGGEFYVKNMNGKEWIGTICDLGSSVWENAALPEDYWSKDVDKGYEKSTIHLPPTLTGVSDGGIDLVSDVPQLVKLGYDVASKEEVRSGIWKAVKNITPSSVKEMAVNSVKEKIAKYNFSDKPYLGYHEIGRDGVQVASMIMGAGFLKNGADALEKGVKETGETFVKRIYKSARELVEDVVGKRVHIRNNIIDVSETKNLAKLYAKKIGVKESDFEDWFTNTFKKTEKGTINFEAHHVIPIDVLEKNEKLQDLLFNMRKNNPDFSFDFNSIDNGMMGQKKSLDLDINGHAKHNQYSDAISEKITNIITDAGGDNVLAMKNIEELIKNTKKTLKDEVLLGNKSVNDVINF